jgi:tight adherence protein B
MLLVGLAVMALMAGAIALLLRRRPTMLVGRLGAYLSITPAEESRRRPLLTDRLVAGTESSLAQTRWWTSFEEELEIAAIDIAPAQIVVGTAVGTLIAGIVLFMIWPPLFLAAAAVPIGVRALIKRKLAQLRGNFLEQLPDNLQVLASALRAGHSFTGALAVVANDSPEPARREFQRVVADEQLGVPVENSLREVARRMDSTDVEQVALLAELQREAGGNMAEVLDTVVETIRERFDLRRLVRTLTAQGRFARWILSLLPAFLLGIISLLNPRYMQPLFETAGGRIVLMLATLMVIAGSFVIKRIVDIKV